MRALALFLLPVLVSGVRAEDPPGTAKKAADPRQLKPGHAPTPYTAAQIHEGCSDRTATFRLERAGKPTMMQSMRFTDANEKNALLEVAVWPERGGAPGKGPGRRVSWSALQAHASFPNEATKIVDAKIETPVGTLACLVYTVTKGDTVNRFCFAKALPGPPVLLTSVVKGGRVFSMTLVKHRDGTEKGVLTALGLGTTTTTAAAATASLAKLDKDKSGGLGPAEFPGTGLTKTQAARAFARIDRNANGTIDAAELAHVAKAWAPKPAQASPAVETPEKVDEKK